MTKRLLVLAFGWLALFGATLVPAESPRPSTPPVPRQGHDLGCYFDLQSPTNGGAAMYYTNAIPAENVFGSVGGYAMQIDYITVQLVYNGTAITPTFWGSGRYDLPGDDAWWNQNWSYNQDIAFGSALANVAATSTTLAVPENTYASCDLVVKGYGWNWAQDPGDTIRILLGLPTVGWVWQEAEVIETRMTLQLRWRGTSED